MYSVGDKITMRDYDDLMDLGYAQIIASQLCDKKGEIIGIERSEYIIRIEDDTTQYIVSDNEFSYGG